MSCHSLSAAPAVSLIAESVLEQYLARYPALQGSAPVVIARSDSTVSLVNSISTDLLASHHE